MSARRKERAKKSSAKQESTAACLMDLVCKPIKYNPISETMLLIRAKHNKTKTMLTLLSIIVQSLFVLCQSTVANGNHMNFQMISADTNLNMQQPQQQKPITSTDNQSKAIITTTQKSLLIQANDLDKKLAPELTVTTTENADISAGSITEMFNATHLELQSAQSPELSTGQNPTAVDIIASSDINSISSPKSPRGSYKNRRDARDWWRKIPLASKTPVESETRGQYPIDAGKTNGKGYGTGYSELHPLAGKSKPVSFKPTKRPPIYIEQPLNQNALLTIKYQLAAIEGRKKVLITRSMRQLEQLDSKLIDSYRYCLKKKAPLYAGMLYRTRDFVAKMAKEAKHERKVLDAMTKQVQGVLKQKMTNRTLVREYKKLAAASTELPVILRPDRLENGVQEYSSASKSKYDINTTQDTEDQLEPPVGEAPGIHKTRSHSNKKFMQTAKTGKVYSGDLPLSKKGKLSRYIVSVNEVNLKKELNKIQALIDRINVSSYELNAVADDITYLFKLSSMADKKGSSFKMGKLDKYFIQSESHFTPEQRQARKLIKSPIKNFLEKYSNKYANLEMMPNNQNNSPPTTATSVTTNQSAETTSNLPTNNLANSTSIDNLPDMIKPLFEPANLVYTEPVDQNIGFDSYVAETDW